MKVQSECEEKVLREGWPERKGMEQQSRTRGKVEVEQAKEKLNVKEDLRGTHNGRLKREEALRKRKRREGREERKGS